MNKAILHQQAALESLIELLSVIGYKDDECIVKAREHAAMAKEAITEHELEVAALNKELTHVDSE